MPAKWNNFFYTGFSAESLGLLRGYFGFCLIPFHFSQFADHLATLDPFGPAFYFTRPMWHFDLIGLHYHLPIVSFVAFGVLIAATISMAVGKSTRLSIAIVIICIFYLKGVRDSFTGDVHHRYFIPIHMLFLLLLSQSGATHSWDARVRSSESPLTEWQASWPIKAMQVYCVSFYLWSVIAKLRVTGWAWFAVEGQLQEKLIRRSVRWGINDTGEAVNNVWAFQIAHMPELLLTFNVLIFVIEAGFPFILLIKRTKWRIVILAIVTAFHITSVVLLHVGFILIPIVFLMFFDLVPVHAWLLQRWQLFVGRWKIKRIEQSSQRAQM